MVYRPVGNAQARIPRFRFSRPRSEAHPTAHGIVGGGRQRSDDRPEVCQEIPTLEIRSDIDAPKYVATLWNRTSMAALALPGEELEPAVK